MSRTYDGWMRREYAEKADDGYIKLESTCTTLDGTGDQDEWVKVRVTVEILEDIK